MTIHDLTIEPQYLAELLAGTKTFEVRERRNRDFRLGDMLRFENAAGTYLFDVTYVFDGGKYGVADGWVVMSVQRTATRPDMVQ